MVMDPSLISDTTDGSAAGMSGPIVRSGPTKDYSDNWDSVFGGKPKKKAKAKSAKKTTAKKNKATKKKKKS